jgi:hypothetical protein
MILKATRSLRNWISSSSGSIFNLIAKGPTDVLLLENVIVLSNLFWAIFTGFIMVGKEVPQTSIPYKSTECANDKQIVRRVLSVSLFLRISRFQFVYLTWQIRSLHGVSNLVVHQYEHLNI